MRGVDAVDDGRQRACERAVARCDERVVALARLCKQFRDDALRANEALRNEFVEALTSNGSGGGRSGGGSGEGGGTRRTRAADAEVGRERRTRRERCWRRSNRALRRGSIG